MSEHSYSCCLLHLTWAVKNRQRLLTSEIRPLLHSHFSEYAQSKDIFMKICFINADHIHALIDLRTDLTIENVVKLMKGESSHWINVKIT